MRQQYTRFLALFSLLLLLTFLPLPVLAEEAPPPAQTAESAPPEAAQPPSSVRPAAEGQGLYLPPFEPAAAAVCLVNEDTGLTVYEKNADAPVVAASLVKLMTAILTMDKVQDLDAETVTADQQWVFDALYGKNASVADIRQGETLSIRELLYAMLLPSGNEAALLLADYVSGGYVENFLFMMNSRAAALGCTGTTFTDPNGLSEGNITTARDITRIMREFSQYPVLMEIAATPVYEMAAHEAHAAPYNIFSTNRLLAETSPYYGAFPASAGTILGGKTGSLGEWQNFASVAEGENGRYICAVMNSPNAADVLGATFEVPQARPALYESAQLYDWAFQNLQVSGVLDTSLPITEVQLRYCMETDVMKLVPLSDMRTLLPSKDSGCAVETQLDFQVPESISAPVQQGDAIGSVTVSLSLDGAVMGTIGSSDLVAETGAQRNNTLYIVRRVQEFFDSVFFKVLVGILLGVVLLYTVAVILVGLVASQKKHKRARRRKR